MTKRITSTLSLILLLFLMGGMNLSFKKYDCSSFKTGKYVVKNEKFDTYIIRKNNYQIEYSSDNKLKLKSKITWTSDCEYYISDYKILENPNNMDVSQILQGEKIYFTILKTKKNYIITEAVMKKYNFKTEIKYDRVK